jgi:hypothetical protein
MECLKIIITTITIIIITITITTQHKENQDSDADHEANPQEIILVASTVTIGNRLKVM